MPTGRKRGGQPGHKGSSRKLLSSEEVDRIVDVKPGRCEHCNTALFGDDPLPRRHQVTEIPPVKPEVIEYRLHTLVCPYCRQKNQAGLPAGVPVGAFGGRLLAMVAMCSGAYRLSKRTIAVLMRDFFGVDISLGSISACEEAISGTLENPVAEARTYVQKQPVKHMDETGWKEGSRKKAWLWAAVTSMVTVFMIHASRGQKAFQEFMEEFKGYIVSDRWSAYNIWDLRKRQLCWAHLIRNFKALAEEYAPEIAEALLAETKTMFQLWHRVRDGTLKRSSFRTYLSPLRQRVEALLRKGAACGDRKTEKAYLKILKFAPALWTFARIEGVEPTNNMAERAIRPGVLWRKGSFGTDSERGSRFAERMMTVVATCKQQGRNPFHFITAAVNASLRGDCPPTLLPLYFQESPSKKGSLLLKAA